MKRYKSLFEAKIKISYEDMWDSIEYYDSYRDIYPGHYEDSEDENQYEDEYYFNSKKDAVKWAEDILDLFNTLQRKKDIILYRAVRLKNVDDLDTDYLGESWSWDKKNAREFGSHANANYLITAKTKSKNIDWEKSIKKYIKFSQGWNIDDEKELVVIEDNLKYMDIMDMEEI